MSVASQIQACSVFQSKWPLLSPRRADLRRRRRWRRGGRVASSAVFTLRWAAASTAAREAVRPKGAVVIQAITNKRAAINGGLTAPRRPPGCRRIRHLTSFGLICDSWLSLSDELPSWEGERFVSRDKSADCARLSRGTRSRHPPGPHGRHTRLICHTGGRDSQPYSNPDERHFLRWQELVR